jgi:hypothetical protein
MLEFLQWSVVDLDQNMIGISDVIIFFGLAKTLPQSFSLSCLKPQPNRLGFSFWRRAASVHAFSFLLGR